MVLKPDTEFGLPRLIGDDTPEFITLTPGQLANFRDGVWALGGNDTIIGSSEGELIIANQGQDSVLGNGGNDSLFGSRESDLVDGGPGNDFVRGDLDPDTVRGGEGNDFLLGGKGNDQLFGDNGTDTLSGDLGADTLTGGGDADIFVLRQNGEGTDFITDFQDGIDLIQLPDGVTRIALQPNNNQVTISISATGEQIAILNNVPASAITSADFIGAGVVPTPTPTPIPTPTPATGLEAFEQRVLDLTNEFRQQNGVQPLVDNSKLNAAAENHSQDMAIKDYTSHTGLDGSTPSSRSQAQGYASNFIGENIGFGYATPEAVVEGWKNSPSHRANMLNPNYTEIGIGYYFLQNDTGNQNWFHYWTQVFGAS